MSCNQFKWRALSVALLFFLFFLYAPDGITQNAATTTTPEGANQADAEAGNSAVKGIVQSANNEPLTGVSVTVRNTKTNFASGTTTDTSGIFTFPKLPPEGLIALVFLP